MHSDTSKVFLEHVEKSAFLKIKMYITGLSLVNIRCGNELDKKIAFIFFMNETLSICHVCKLRLL